MQLAVESQILRIKVLKWQTVFLIGLIKYNEKCFDVSEVREVQIMKYRLIAK